MCRGKCNILFNLQRETIVQNSALKRQYFYASHRCLLCEEVYFFHIYVDRRVYWEVMW